MNDPLAQLIELRPTVGESKIDIDKMTSQIVKAYPRMGDSIMRKFRLRMGAAVAATSTITALGISGLTGLGASLPVISLVASAQSASKVMSSDGLVGQASMSPMVCDSCFYDPTHLVAGPNFPTSISPVATYQLGEKQLTPEALSLFNMTASDGQIDGASQSTIYTNDTGTLSNSGLFLTYSATAQNFSTGRVEGRSAISVGAPSIADLKQGFMRLFSNLEPELGIANFQMSDNSATSGNATTGQFNTWNFYEISFQISVDGTNAVSVYGGSAEVDSNGNLVHLTVPFFSLQRSVAYPLQSPIDALAVVNNNLEAQRGRYVAAQHSTTTLSPGPIVQDGSGSGSSGIVIGGPSAQTADTSTTSVTTTTLPALVDSVIDQVSLKYEIVSDSTGATWLVPFYEFIDNGSNNSWVSPAVSSEYIKVPVNASWSSPLMYEGVARPSAVR